MTPSSIPRKWPAFLAALAVIAALALSVIPFQAARADSERPFGQVFNAQEHGDIVITGNGLLACDSADDNCAAAQAGTASNNTASNNHWDMQPIDLDDDASTTRSSMASVDIPAGSEVLYAGLYWGGSAENFKLVDGKKVYSANTEVQAAGSAMKLRAPGGEYREITAATTGLNRNRKFDYGSSADITEIVQAAGPGEYWGADVASTVGQDHYAGWAMVVVFKNADLPLRDLSVYEGYAQMEPNFSKVSIDINGFLTPLTGPVNATVGTVVWEGDVSFAKDYLEVDGKRIGDDLSPAGNFYNGVVANKGVLEGNRNPAYARTMQIDAKTTALPDGSLANGDTDLTLSLGTAADRYIPHVITTAIDLYDAHLTPVKAVTNLDGNDPAKVGDTLEYTVTVTNDGVDTSDNVVFSDTIPAGTTYVPGSLTVTAGADTTALTDAAGDDAGEYADGKITARIGTGADATTGGSMGQDEVIVITFQATVNKASAEGSIANSASLSYQGATMGTKRTATSNGVDTPVGKHVDLRIAKETLEPEVPEAGTDISWGITVTNDGASDTDGVVVTDTLPEGLTFVSATDAECTAEAAVVTCQLGALASGAERSFVLTTRIAPDYYPEAVTNEASVSSNDEDANEENNAVSTSVYVDMMADLSMAKSVEPTEARPGEEVTWTLTVTNNGPSTAELVRVMDLLPEGLVFVSGSERCYASDEVRTAICAWDSLAPGESLSGTVVTRIVEDAQAGDVVTNTATVTSETYDPNEDNDSASADVTVGKPMADLSIVKELSSEQVAAGKSVAYRLIVSNAGSSTATGVTVSDDLPASLANVTANTADGTCEIVDQTVSCAVESIAVNQEVVVTITGDVAPSARGELTNSASISSETDDPDLSNNSSSVTNEIVAEADVSIIKTASAARAGEDVTYTFTVKNHGPATAGEVTVTDEFPEELTFVAASSSCVYSGGTLTCTLGDMAPQAATELTATMHVPSDVADASSILNTASVSTTTADPNEDNNSSSATIATDTDADLAITKTGPESIQAGEIISWDITIVNNGPSDATNVEMMDPFPENVTADSIDGLDPSVGSCGTPILGTSYDCNFDSVAAGETITFTVNAKVESDYDADTLSNTATVSSDTPDSSMDNNSSTAVSLVGQSADLSIVKTNTGSIRPGRNTNWMLEVTNNGPSDAVNVKVTDVLSSEQTLSKLSEDEGCVASGQVVTCTVDRIRAHDTELITVSADVTDTVYADKLVNTASVTSDTPDPDTSNNADSAESLVVPESDLDIEKIGPDTVYAGEQITWEIGSHNMGISDAHNAVITDTLPEGLENVEAVSNIGECSIVDRVITCDLGILLRAHYAFVKITAVVSSDYTGEQLVNTASISSDSFDDNERDNSASFTTAVLRTADVSILKSAPSMINVGEEIAWRITVINDGPSDAHMVTVADTLPEGLGEASVDDEACSIADGVLGCEFDSLAPGVQRTITVTAAVPDDFMGTELVNSATVSSPDDSSDVNNTASSTTVVSHLADLSIRKIGPETLKSGETGEWKIFVVNSGPSAAHEVDVIDPLPEGLIPSSLDVVGGFDCAIIDRVLSCHGESIGADLTVAITVNARVEDSFDGTIVNTASVNASTADPNEDNNVASATTTVGTPPPADPPADPSDDPGEGPAPHGGSERGSLGSLRPDHPAQVRTLDAAHRRGGPGTCRGIRRTHGGGCSPADHA